MFSKKDQNNDGISTIKMDGNVPLAFEGEVLYENSLITVASQLTCTLVNVSSQKPERPEDIVATFGQVHALLQDWYSGAPKKRELKEMLDTMLPKIGYMGTDTVG